MPYVKPKKAREELGVTDQTLRIWADEGRIKSITAKGGMRLYDISTIKKGQEEEPIKKQKYIYCRVSTSKQKEDLERQVSYLSNKYPEHKVIKEIASGINFKRKAFQRLLDACTCGGVEEIVVANKDRLCRFAWEHFKWFFHRFGANIIVDSEEDSKEQSREQELADDLLSIVHVFSSRHYGSRRKYTKKGTPRGKDKNAEVETEYESEEEEYKN